MEDNKALCRSAAQSSGMIGGRIDMKLPVRLTPAHAVLLGFAGIILHGEEEVAVFARELLLKILQIGVAVAGLLLKKSRIVIGGGSHIAEKCI